MLPAGVVLCQDAGKLARGRHHGSSQPVQVPSHRHHIQLTRLLKALRLQGRRSHEPKEQVRPVVMPRSFGTVCGGRGTGEKPSRILTRGATGRKEDMKC